MQVKNLVTLFLYYNDVSSPPPPVISSMFADFLQALNEQRRVQEGSRLLLYVLVYTHSLQATDGRQVQSTCMYIAHCPLRFNQACSERSFFYIDFITLQQNKYVRKNVKSRYSRKQQTGRIDFLLCHLVNSWFSACRVKTNARSRLYESVIHLICRVL